MLMCLPETQRKIQKLLGASKVVGLVVNTEKVEYFVSSSGYRTNHNVKELITPLKMCQNSNILQ
jgi:hypothetical protein